MHNKIIRYIAEYEKRKGQKCKKTTKERKLRLENGDRERKI